MVVAAFVGKTFLGCWFRVLSAYGVEGIERFHVLCSSSKTEYSWTWTNYIGFATSRWAKGLGWDYDAKEAVTMEADSDSDNKVTLEELYNYSSTRIPNNKQTIVVYPDNDNFVVGGRY